MDLQLINKGVNFTKKKKKWVLILAILGVSGYSAIRVYNSPSIVRKRIRVLKLLNSISRIIDVFSDCSETIGIISRDLNEFIRSDSDEIPKSLKQFAKLIKSDEFSDCVFRVSDGFTRGVFNGYEVVSRDGNGSGLGFYDRVVDRLFSSDGTGFVSVVVGSFARNLVSALYCSEEGNVGGLKWVDVVCEERFREVIGGFIERFVSTAVAVYLDKTMDVNTYDELFAGLTNPKRENRVREMLVAVCNGSIETLVKTSHHVLTNTSPNLGTRGKLRSGSCNVVTPSGLNEVKKSSSDEGWVSTVSSTLAVPSNRKLMLDVTGRVTFESVRSFLEFLVEKFFANGKRSFGAVNEAVIETGRGVMRYFTAKASMVASICLYLCLHVLGGTLALMPA